MGSLRAALRHHTSDAHQRLDDMVGSFADATDYRRFVADSHAFRAMVEPACGGIGFWQFQPLLGHLQQDMDDLELRPRPGPSPRPLALDTPSAQLGALYVLEGSALGARQLLRQAENLGFSHTFGARHLAAQTADPARFRLFLSLLETMPGTSQDEVLASAETVFRYAGQAYLETARERV